jgi:hypothetical protein
MYARAETRGIHQHSILLIQDSVLPFQGVVSSVAFQFSVIFMFDS